jgi:cellulose synthase/poly-beta-1,6-N-acetylglucosamine synthase-like glycosyltransferase
VDPASQRREVRDALGSMAVRWGQVVSARLGAREMGRASGEGKRENWAELKDIGPRRIHYFVLFFFFSPFFISKFHFKFRFKFKSCGKLSSTCIVKSRVPTLEVFLDIYYFYLYIFIYFLFFLLI